MPQVDVLSSLSKVPPFPPIAARLLTLLSDESVSIAELAELIGLRDTFIAAGVALIAVILTLAATRNSLRAIDQTIELDTAHADPLLVPNVMVTPD